MQTTLSLQSWLDHLRLLNPVTGVVHVGAGVGRAVDRYMDWGVPSAVLIEADESCHENLTAVAFGHPGWSVHTALLSDQEEEKDFYLASNSNENGILPPECLTSLWRNLKTKEQRLLNANTLDCLLIALNPQSETVNWVVIDCLPALPVLRGAGQRLDDWDVIVARVVLDQSQLQAIGASKAEVDTYLLEHGYRCIACEEERQPAVGKALYVRDWKTSLHARLHSLQQDAAIQAEVRTQLQKSLGKQIPLLAECQQQVMHITKTSEEQTKLAAELQAQLEQLTKSKDEQTKLATERQQQVGQLTKANEVQSNQLTKDKAKLLSERDAQSKLAGERATQLEQQTKARIEAERQANERQQQLNEKQNRVQQLEAEVKDIQLRQHLLKEELIKAEGQVALITDLFRQDRTS